MKPYGREKKIFGGSSKYWKNGNWKKDVHPPKGYINWWEDEMDNFYSRSRMKQIIRKEIEKEIEDLKNEKKYKN